MILRVVLVVAMAAVLLPALPAGAQDEAPPCPPGVAPTATFQPGDSEDAGGPPLTATHTIGMRLHTSEGEVDEFQIEVPPGVRTLERGSPAFRVDSPGPVPVTARWEHYSPQMNADCTASAQATFDIQPARRPKFDPPRRRSLTSELDWYVRFGKNMDRRPIQVRIRAVRRARVPRRSVRVRTATYGLRSGDKGVSLAGNSEKVLRTPAGRFSVTFGHDDDLWIALRNLPRGRRPVFGVDLQLVQGGRTIGRTRLKGRCNAYYCSYRTVR